MEAPSKRQSAERLSPLRAQTVEKVAKLLFRMGLHEISTSISCEIVGQNFVRGVISEAHVLENDEIRSYSVVCGRRNSLQEGFFDKQSAERLLPLRALLC